MNLKKQLQKLVQTFTKAEACLERDTAQKLIRKADKIRSKLEQ